MQKDKFLFEKLSLKPEQTVAMKEKAIPFRKEIDEKRHEIANKRKELIGIMRADTPDVGAINSVISEISRMQEAMQKRVTIHMLEEKALLEKDQQKKFLDLIENAMTEGRQAGCPSTEHN
jgi:Spy/CpxP family protein refolding chaperone